MLYRCLTPTVISLRTKSLVTYVQFMHNKSTVEKDVTNHFDKLANKWWDKQDNEAKALHSMNPLRIKLITEGLANVGTIQNEHLTKPKPLEGLKLLEVGCGGGILSEPLARLGADVTGLDASETMITVAKHHAANDPKLENKIKYIYSTIEEHSRNNLDTYDIIVASEVVEHIAEKKFFIDNCVATLKPGGSFFITTINKTFYAWFGAVFLGEKLFRRIPEGTHEYEKLVSPDELERILISCNCHTVLVSGTIYNFLLNRWSWTRNTSITYALHAVKK